MAAAHPWSISALRTSGCKLRTAARHRELPYSSTRLRSGLRSWSGLGGEPVGQPNRLCLSVVVGTLLLAYLAFDHPFRTGPGGFGGVTDEFLGSWTDDRGEPGNSVRFSLVEVPLPNAPLGMSAYEGRATFHKLFGADEVRATWGYENFDPPRLNVTFAG